MTDQLDIFSLPYQRNSATSRAAARAMAPRAGSIASRVYTFIDEQGRRGATREEIQLALRMKIQTVCSTVHALLRRKLVGPCGVRLTTGGNPAEVLVLKEFAE